MTARTFPAMSAEQASLIRENSADKGVAAATHHEITGGVGATRPDPRLHLRIVPVTFQQACAFVAAWHRRHEPPRGHKFSLGVATDDDVLHGIAIVGRPVARLLQDGLTLEVTRTATDGTPNANSALYGAAWRAARALGYRRSGVSLRGAGWRVVAERRPRRGWDTPSRPRRLNGTEGIQRTLWQVS